jgi:uncharacterized damage-inducible protein DinB
MLLLAYIDELQSVKEGDLWIDETFDKKLDTVNDLAAFTSPMPGYNSVAQIVAHLLAWRRSTLSILQGGKKTVTTDALDWPDNETLQVIGWEKLKNDFYQSQQDLIHFLSAKDDSFLALTARDTGKSFDYYIRGLIHHDMYHLGQIGLVIKMINTISKPLNRSTI